MDTITQYTRRDGSKAVRSVISIKNYIRKDGQRVLYVNLEGQYSYTRIATRNTDGQSTGTWEGAAPSPEQEAQIVAIIRLGLHTPTATLKMWKQLPTGQIIYAPRETTPRRYTREEIESGRADEDMDFAGADYTSR